MFGILKRDSVISSTDRFFEIDFRVTWYIAPQKINEKISFSGLVVLAPLALFRECTLTTSVEKVLERNGNAHKFCWLYEFLSKSKNSKDLSFGLDESNSIRKVKVTDN